MRITLESDEPASKETEAWFHRVVWACFGWLQVLPSGIVRSDDGETLYVPVKRATVTGPGFGGLLGRFFGSVFTPSKMTFVGARLTIRDVSHVDLASVGPVPQGWVQLDAPISMDRSNANTILIGMTSWPRSEWMLKITVKRLDVELADEPG